MLGIELFVALSLTVSFFFLIRPTCRVGPDGNTISRHLFSYLAANANPVAKQHVQLNWQKRLAGPIVSGWLMDAGFKDAPDFNGTKFENIFGFYNCIWIALLFLTLICFREDALWLMLGTTAGLMYYLSDPGGAQFYPWDLPTMFFFTLAVLLSANRRMWVLMVAIWLGALFKETNLCCALLILFGPQWPLKKRLAGFAATVVVTFATYALLMRVYGMNAPLFAGNSATSAHDLIWKSVMANNLHVLFSLDARHVLFANAGGLFLMMLIPWKNRRDVILKFLIITYIIGEFFWGIINEFRIWYEVLPLGWMIVYDWYAARPSSDGNVADRVRILKGSYWLMMSVLFVLAAFICLGTKSSLTAPPADDAARMTISELLMAAPRGNVSAQYWLANSYQNGTGVEKDNNEAVHWYLRAAEKGYPNAINALGTIQFEQQDYADAVTWFGRGAAQGDANSQYNLGVLYLKGLGVGQSDQLAFQWLQKSAIQGQVDAQELLGKMYQSGHGTPQDYAAAYRWFKLAQLQGDKNVAAGLEACAAQLTPDQIADAERQVQSFKNQSK